MYSVFFRVFWVAGAWKAAAAGVAIRLTISVRDRRTVSNILIFFAIISISFSFLEIEIPAAGLS